MKFSHENLEIWQLGMKLVELVYSLKDRFLPEDKFGLWDQLVRSIEAVPRDIAEGYGKNSRKERALYMERAKSETAEADTSFKQAVQKGRISEEEYENSIKPLIKELYFKLIGYRKWLLRVSSKPAKSAGDQPSPPSPPNRRAISHLLQARQIGGRSLGFTLIEMMVALGIFVLISTAAVGMFLTILKSVSKTQVINEVKQNGDYAIGVMGQMIRNARRINSCSNNSIQITNPDGGVTTFNCVSEDSVTKIASVSGIGSGRLTGKNVTLGSSCPGSFSLSCDRTNAPPTVNISFTVSQAGSSTRQEDRATMYFRTAVSFRTYQ